MEYQNYKILGGGFVYQEDQMIYDFAQENGGIDEVLGLGLEELNDRFNAFIKRQGYFNLNTKR